MTERLTLGLPLSGRARRQRDRARGRAGQRTRVPSHDRYSRGGRHRRLAARWAAGRVRRAAPERLVPPCTLGRGASGRRTLCRGGSRMGHTRSLPPRGPRGRRSRRHGGQRVPGPTAAVARRRPLGVDGRPRSLPRRHARPRRDRRPARPATSRRASHRRWRRGVHAHRAGTCSWQHPVVVHPQFTEPEAALAAAGYDVERVLLREETGFRLDADRGARGRRPGDGRQPDQPDRRAAPGGHHPLAAPPRSRRRRRRGLHGRGGATRRVARVRTPARPGGDPQPDQDLVDPRDPGRLRRR